MTLGATQASRRESGFREREGVTNVLELMFRVTGVVEGKRGDTGLGGF